MPVIASLHGREILDSRGHPTVAARCELAGGASGSASVPSGRSTGRAEAVELRDGDPTRYGGLGCRKAAAGIAREVNRALSGSEFGSQAELDGALVKLDGTADKSRLGANALLAVSLAFARAAAADRGIPLYRYFADLRAVHLRALPRLTVNLFSGGRHAGGQVPIQDVLVAPLAASSIDASLSTTFAVYQSAAELVSTKYAMRLLRADEGGLAPPCGTAEAMLEDAVSAIESAGYLPGRDVALAVDVAASHFYENARYRLDNRLLSGAEMVGQLAGWLDRYPIVSLEDGLAEDDWEHWRVLVEAARGRVLVLGDDLLCTNPARIERAIADRAATALLVKVNQIGTLTEAAEACRLARAAGWRLTVSARSGETEDDWLADLAVGWDADQIKVGSITQSDRLAKYNRLLAIETETGLPVRAWSA